MNVAQPGEAPGGPRRQDAEDGHEGFTVLGGQTFYRIGEFDRMPPFLMSLVSDSDLWMYVSSYGGLAAGRVDEDHCLFPYQTDDQIHLCGGLTGPITLLRVRRPDGTCRLWEPFTDRIRPGGVRRNLYRNAVGNCVIFEEIHGELGMTFRYRWGAAEPLGFVRTATLAAHEAAAPAEVELLDGLLNLLPSGADWSVQHRFSCLLNAYTRCEVDEATHLGICSMTSQLTDKAEPAESLRATVAWCVGLEPFQVVLSADRVREFRQGTPARPQRLLEGRRGAYLVSARFSLRGGQERTWYIAADVDRDQGQVQRLGTMLADGEGMRRRIREAIDQATANLRRLVARADGLQATQDRAACVHHFANVLFNNMRGGVFVDGYELPGRDFAAAVRRRNRAVHEAHEPFLAGLEGWVNLGRLLEDVRRRDDPNLLRLTYEYLPLTFSRRHGDPSRPWNQFTIRVRDADGQPVLAYQGNWRDIFQNWEALCWSFPGYLPSIIAKFVNASTVDGFNPYRLSQDGIDWETPAPDEPWANLGYWGDHQIVYLLKLLEACRRFHPGALEELLTRPLFAYADVPYRLKPYEDILRDPRSTIEFDRERAAAVDRRVQAVGADGRLVLGPDGSVLHVALAEKLLVPALSKLSNLVADGGIWMNTQRPEWNDANNALVGHGVSMVTLCYLRRYLAFCAELFDDAGAPQADISTEVLEWADRVQAILAENCRLLSAPQVDDKDRKLLLDRLGRAFGEYRARVYRQGLTGRTARDLRQLSALFRLAGEYLDHAIRANRRPDGLYHAYNLLSVSRDGQEAGLGRLNEMLEGQVAVLSSGAISAEEALEVLEALRASKMYRPDQDSFLLYPDRELPGFLDKNRIPAAEVEANGLLAEFVRAGETSVLSRDVAGHYRFHADFRNAGFLAAALERLAGQPRWSALVASHGRRVPDVYERVFHHAAFTGRSGTMYGYEGLGCIYWHMVAKLLLAVQECFFRAARERSAEATVRALGEAYYRVRKGLGFNKTATEFGAFPTDPYSHTPARAGAQQPGMTGQVKEEVLTRLGELGVQVNEGRLTLDPILLRRAEFLAGPRDWTYVDVGGQERRIGLSPGMLAFTFCQTPIVYELADDAAGLAVWRADGSRQDVPGNDLDAAISRSIFERSGEVVSVHARVPAARLLCPNDETDTTGLEGSGYHGAADI